MKRKDSVKFEKKITKPKRYPMRPLAKTKVKAKIFWYPDSMFSVLEDEDVGKMLFSDYWIGQLGIYKQDRGRLLKLDFMETVFLAKFFDVEIYDVNKKKSVSYKEVMRHVKDVREYAEHLYNVYEDWRLRGYVVKTGFKFGTHFRIYFPGASPTKQDKWIHSKHVIHVFPKEQKLVISEWARAVRVAHGVKKTFLLSVPEMMKKDYIDYPAEYFAYRRKNDRSGWIRETPDDNPRYLLVPVSEDEHIGGAELASLLKMAEGMGVEVLLSITDRETAITYYVLKKIILPGSKYESYEIEWMKP
ncbi:MAG: tRNA-intron lyase [Candidatus Aenigmatarchaeota archaeon]